MGFHLVQFVYDYAIYTDGVKGPRRIRGPALSILAYIAFRADDCGEKPCFPSKEAIASATHLSVSCVEKALTELREAKVLAWVRGGRRKGGGGVALANSYHVVIDGVAGVYANAREDRNAKQASVFQTSIPYVAGYASPATEGMHPPPRTDHHTISSKGRQPSVTEKSERGSVVRIGESGAQWVENMSKSGMSEACAQSETDRLVRKAMKVCGTEDPKSAHCFLNTMKCRDPGRCEDLIDAFESELKNGEHRKAKNIAAILNKRIAERVRQGVNGEGCCEARRPVDGCNP